MKGHGLGGSNECEWSVGRRTSVCHHGSLRACYVVGTQYSILGSNLHADIGLAVIVSNGKEHRQHGTRKPCG